MPFQVLLVILKRTLPVSSLLVMNIVTTITRLYRVNTCPSSLQSYLKELGIEQYDLDRLSVASIESAYAGKYYSDVPLEENPEAAFGKIKPLDTHFELFQRKRYIYLWLLLLYKVCTILSSWRF